MVREEKFFVSDLPVPHRKGMSDGVELGAALRLLFQEFQHFRWRQLPKAMWLEKQESDDKNYDPVSDWVEVVTQPHPHERFVE